MSSTSKSDPEEVYSLSDTSSATYYRSSGDHEDLPRYITARRRRSLFAQILVALRLQQRHPDYYDYFGSPQDDLLDGLLKKPKSRDARKCRGRPRVTGSLVKRLCIAIPIIALTGFGLLHLMHVLIGQGRLFWDVDSPEHILPFWGKPGHAGQDLVRYPTDATRDVLPIPCHSHNDYWRRVPFYEAINSGCTSIEADVWLFDEELYVGHSMGALSRNRTLKNLYLKPIVNMLDKMNKESEFTNNTGRGIFDEDQTQPLVLLIDLKTNGHETLKVVERQLKTLRDRDYLTYWNGEKIIQKAVTIVGTGNAPYDKIANASSHRDIFFDAPLERFWEPAEDKTNDLNPHETQADYEAANAAQMPKIHSAYKTSSTQGKVGTSGKSLDDFNPSNTYYASASLRSSVGYIWGSHLSDRQLDIIRGHIRGAHRRGLKVRYWDTPSWPVELRNHVWNTLMKEGADILNVDDLKAAATENWKMKAHDWWKKS